MKVSVELIPIDEEEEAQFKIHAMSDNVTKAMHLLTFSDKETRYLLGKIEEKYYKINVDDIFYIESVERKVFAYAKKQTFELSDKLYVLEEQLRFFNFVRITKSMLLNVDKIYSFYPKLSGNLEAHLINNEKVMISRRYVSSLKRKLGMGDNE